MKKLIFTLICFYGLTLFSQNIEISSGLIINKFHDFNYDEGHYESSYDSGLGYSILVGIENFGLDDLDVKWMRLRVTLAFDKYSGSLEAYHGGLGGGSKTNAEVNKSIISLGLFPINFDVKNKVDLNLGFEFSVLIDEAFNGTQSGWMMGQPPTGYTYDLNEKYDRYSEILYFGLKGRIAYNFNISDTFVISPQYSFYLGLSREFDQFPRETKSMRHYFCIGIEKRIKPKAERNK